MSKLWPDSCFSICRFNNILRHPELPDSGFKAKQWTEIIAILNKKTGIIFSTQQLHSKPNDMIKKKIFQALKGNSGFGWDWSFKFHSSKRGLLLSLTSRSY